MTPETNPLFEQFLIEHPEHASGVAVVQMPDGTEETCASLETLEAFMKWCLANGYGDAHKIVRFLAEFRPRVEEVFRERGPDPAPE